MRRFAALVLCGLFLTGCAFNLQRAKAEERRALNICDDRIGKEITTSAALALCYNDASRRAFSEANFPDMDLAERYFAERLELARRWDARAITTDEYRHLDGRNQEQFRLDLDARTSERQQRDAALVIGLTGAAAILQNTYVPPAPAPRPIICSTMPGIIPTTICH